MNYIFQVQIQLSSSSIKLEYMWYLSSCVCHCYYEECLQL